MEIRADAAKKKHLRDHCGKIVLRAQSEAEEKWLARLYLHIVHDEPEPGPRPEPE